MPHRDGVIRSPDESAIIAIRGNNPVDDAFNDAANPGWRTM